MTGKAPKVIFIGLDAADKDRLNQWADEGLLPNWKKLQEDGLTGTTESPIGFYVGAIWPSFYTGVNPARHGHHCWEQIEPGSYEVRRYLAGARVTHEPFWETFSRAGVNSAIIDVPLCGPARELKGVQVIEWGCHDPDMGFITVPESLAEEIEARHTLHPIQGNCNQPGRTADDFIQFKEDLVRGVGMKAKLNEDIKQRYHPELMVTVFSESHCVGHQCWHLHDPNHERYSAEITQKTGDPVKEVYKALDNAIAESLKLAGPDTTVIVWASHGMGGHNDGTFMIDEILQRLEMHYKFASKEWELSLLEKIWPQRGNAKREALKKSLDVPTRTYYPHPNNREESGIRINLAGREPQGFVQPGKEYDEVCAQLTRDLMELTDVHTGSPVVRNVIKTRAVYSGEYIDDLPDLVVQWNDDAPVRSAASPRIGKIAGDCPCVRSGGHRPAGQFTVLGPDIKPGRMNRPVNVLDFAPTMAALLNVHLTDVDGQPVPEFLGNNNH